ncbi:vasculin-like protein 1 [Limulus polyphemus]|uniref:Vasculin n=1 Tax=Limulus polyphemus TaxID=6850 RepID=A0ABM1SYW4_LIMPO|nr:vasculin-like protein 1 [Limulus polyphemus]
MRNKSLSGVNSSLGITASSQEPSSASIASRSRYFLPKAIVPAKQNSSTKKPVRESVLLSSKEIMTNGFEIAGLNSATSLSQPLLNSSSRHHMEILIKNPKVRGNKSEFLKTLQTNTCSMNEVYEKGENHHNRHGGNKTEDEEELFELHKRENYVNGINIEKMSVKDDEESEDINMLSSSLEAEERLLREMGWKEECLDDDNYAPLTEEELKEFHSLTQKLQMNEGKNGIQRNFHRSWSPGHIPQFKNVLSVETNWSSSSDTDSD